MLGAELRRTHPYYPQGDGVVERLVRTVNVRIKTMLRGDTATWPDVVLEVEYFYKNTVHPRHGVKPYSLFTARPQQPLRGSGLEAALPDPHVPQMRRRLKWMTEWHRVIQDGIPAGSHVMQQLSPHPSRAYPEWEKAGVVVRRT